MERLEKAEQIELIYDGKLKVDDAHPDIQLWFEITVCSLALPIIKAPAKKRKAMIDDMKSSMPNWAHDVERFARMVLTGRTT